MNELKFLDRNLKTFLEGVEVNNVAMSITCIAQLASEAEREAD